MKWIYLPLYFNLKAKGLNYEKCFNSNKLCQKSFFSHKIIVNYVGWNFGKWSFYVREVVLCDQQGYIMHQNTSKRSLGSESDQIVLNMKEDPSPNITKNELISLIRDPNIKPRIRKRENKKEVHFYTCNECIVALECLNANNYELLGTYQLAELETYITNQLEERTSGSESSYMEAKIPGTSLKIRVSYRSIKDVLSTIRKTSFRSLLLYIFKRTFWDN